MILIPYILWEAVGLGTMYTSWAFLKHKRERQEAKEKEEAEKAEQAANVLCGPKPEVPHYKGLCCECKNLARADGHTCSYCIYLGEYVHSQSSKGCDCDGYEVRRRSGAMRSTHSWDWQEHFYRSSEEVQVYDMPPRPSTKTNYIDGMRFHEDNKYWRASPRWGMTYEKCKDDPEKLKALDIIFSDDRTHYT